MQQNSAKTFLDCSFIFGVKSFDRSSVRQNCEKRFNWKVKSSIREIENKTLASKTSQIYEFKFEGIVVVWFEKYKTPLIRFLNFLKLFNFVQKKILAEWSIWKNCILISAKILTLNWKNTSDWLAPSLSASHYPPSVPAVSRNSTRQIWKKCFWCDCRSFFKQVDALKMHFQMRLFEMRRFEMVWPFI